MSSIVLERSRGVSECPSAEDEAKALVRRALELFRLVMGECGWTFDALAAHTGKSRSYLHAVLSGEKRMTLDFIVALPVDVRKRHAELVAEAYGWIVAKPLSGEEAHKALLGLLKPAMAKADIRPALLKASGFDVD